MQWREFSNTMHHPRMLLQVIAFVTLFVLAQKLHSTLFAEQGSFLQALIDDSDERETSVLRPPSSCLPRRSDQTLIYLQHAVQHRAFSLLSLLLQKLTASVSVMSHKCKLISAPISPGVVCWCCLPAQCSTCLEVQRSKLLLSQHALAPWCKSRVKWLPPGHAPSRKAEAR